MHITISHSDTRSFMVDHENFDVAFVDETILLVRSLYCRLINKITNLNVPDRLSRLLVDVNSEDSVRA